ncbi:hypothetical protein CORC01_03784 [Colletotrichum orchidophilum]|uniref:F-box domain-containing protein n=1 Tax=Colletotrichum orchidophilum TaxID=1209926 RepID=A0A1G4BHZ4_9PEZI|nr:uncharacterized protein CORC01_03784 [Colletotrichum orchidophilum]OHF00956.1 hypothetical protein CORC01_03784 [Colletotrichum orchidophilum]
MAGATFSTMPNELVRMIVNWCKNGQDARRLCLVDKKTSPSAQHHLYHCITFVPGNFLRLIFLVRTLVENPNLRGLIRHVDFCLGWDARMYPYSMNAPFILSDWHNLVFDESKLSVCESQLLLLCRVNSATGSRLQSPKVVGSIMGLLLCLFNSVVQLTLTQLGIDFLEMQLMGFGQMLVSAIRGGDPVKQTFCPKLKSLFLRPSCQHTRISRYYGKNFQLIQFFLAHPTLEAFTSRYDIGSWDFLDTLGDGTPLSIKKLMILRTKTNALTLSKVLRRCPKLTHLYVDVDAGRMESANGHGQPLEQELGAVISGSCPGVEEISLHIPGHGVYKFFGPYADLEISPFLKSLSNLPDLKVLRIGVALCAFRSESLPDCASWIPHLLPPQAHSLFLDGTFSQEHLSKEPYLAGMRSLILNLCGSHQENQLRFNNLVITVHFGSDKVWNDISRDARAHGAGTAFRLMIILDPSMFGLLWENSNDIPALMSPQVRRGRVLLDSGLI